ncbi:NUDIX domain-containing protein [Streptomyces sp. BI20]|uniref:NUDIX domain-containing protein n=1 Tax=Streptomyces sp. BI20 TaxID=3403460 RepID=UPI003C750D2D
MTTKGVPVAGWLPPREYVATLPATTFYACLYFTDERGRPLQLRSVSEVEPWQFPGGNADHGETPWRTAVRECAEETGIRVTGPPTRLLLAHHVAPRGDAWPAHHIGFVFDGGVLSEARLAALRLDPAEHTEARVLSAREWEPLMPPAGFARLRAVDGARRTGITAYLED